MLCMYAMDAMYEDVCTCTIRFNVESLISFVISLVIDRVVSSSHHHLIRHVVCHP